jgi:hypothetical protein
VADPRKWQKKKGRTPQKHTHTHTCSVVHCT